MFQLRTSQRNRKLDNLAAHIWDTPDEVLTALASFDMAIANIDGAVLGTSSYSAESAVIDLITASEPSEPVVDLVEADEPVLSKRARRRLSRSFA